MSTHRISLYNAILINVNLMIGAGIYFMPPLMAKHAGALSYLGWITCSLIFVPVVMCVAKMSQIFPEAGSFYRYASSGLNRFAGYVCGILYYLGYVAIGAVQLLALHSEVARIFPKAIITTYPILFFIPVIALVCAANFGSLGKIGALQGYITIFKLMPLIFISLLFVPTLSITNLTPTTESASSILFIIPFALFGFWGFESCASLSHRIEGDSRAASRAILIGFFATAGIYTIVHAALVSIMGAGALAQEGVSGFVAALGIHSPVISQGICTLIRASIITAYINAIFGGITANSHLLFAMASEKLMRCSPLLTRTNRNGQPTGAIITQGILTVALATLVSSKGSLGALANLGMISAFIIALVSLFLLIKNNNIRASRTLCILALASCGILAYYSAREIGHIYELVPLALASLLGIALYKQLPINPLTQEN